MPGKILVIDDDPLAIRLMKLALSAEGFQVNTAANAMEGLRSVQLDRPDLIILDIMMPDMDGIQMCRHLRSQSDTADIPVIFMTGKTQVDDRISGLRAGADDYITKPADPREVAVRVEAVLARTKRSTVLSKQGRVLALIGAKGGVGTSTIAVNLGIGLAKRHVATLLLDLHHHSGTIADQLKLTVRASIADLLTLPIEQVASAQLDKALVVHSSGLRVLLSPTVGTKLYEIPAEHGAAIVRAAAAMADVVLLDLPHMLSPATKAALSHSDMALMVMAADPITIACAEQLLPLLEDSGLGGDTLTFALVNRQQAVIALSIGEIERKLQKACLGVLPPASEELGVAERQGVPLAMTSIASVASMALQEMTERVHTRVLGRAPRPR